MVGRNKKSALQQQKKTSATNTTNKKKKKEVKEKGSLTTCQQQQKTNKQTGKVKKQQQQQQQPEKRPQHKEEKREVEVVEGKEAKHQQQQEQQQKKCLVPDRDAVAEWELARELSCDIDEVRRMRMVDVRTQLARLRDNRASAHLLEEDADMLRGVAHRILQRRKEVDATLRETQQFVEDGTLSDAEAVQIARDISTHAREYEQVVAAKLTALYHERSNQLKTLMTRGPMVECAIRPETLEGLYLNQKELEQHIRLICRNTPLAIARLQSKKSRTNHHHHHRSSSSSSLTSSSSFSASSLSSSSSYSSLVSDFSSSTEAKEEESSISGSGSSSSSSDSGSGSSSSGDSSDGEKEHHHRRRRRRSHCQLRRKKLEGRGDLKKK